MKRSLESRVTSLEKSVSKIKKILDSKEGQVYAGDVTYKEAMAAAGKKGAAARAAKLTPERRREIAQKAIAARWSKGKKGEGEEK